MATSTCANFTSAVNELSSEHKYRFVKMKHVKPHEGGMPMSSMADTFGCLSLNPTTSPITTIITKDAEQNIEMMSTSVGEQVIGLLGLRYDANRASSSSAIPNLSELSCILKLANTCKFAMLMVHDIVAPVDRELGMLVENVEKAKGTVKINGTKYFKVSNKRFMTDEERLTGVWSEPTVSRVPYVEKLSINIVTQQDNSFRVQLKMYIDTEFLHVMEQDMLPLFFNIKMEGDGMKVIVVTMNYDHRGGEQYDVIPAVTIEDILAIAAETGDGWDDEHLLTEEVKTRVGPIVKMIQDINAQATPRPQKGSACSRTAIHILGRRRKITVKKSGIEYVRYRNELITLKRAKKLDVAFVCANANALAK